ncbi:E3 ubiquitin-protein ligase MARCHF8 [Rhipicephalus microplus]|uniref:E3 ubiquitin-protein ligase MARCHF8 n=1 Tax=Rhipicephalus microplus TaxID=6941 RepID=UPI003F6D72BF
MPNDQHVNPKEDTSMASLQSAPREEKCLVPSSLPCDTEPSMLPVANDQPASKNSSQNDRDDEVTCSQDNRTPSLPAPALVSGSENEPADDNASQDTPTDSSNEDGSNGPMCRICHEGDQEEALLSLCKCSGTIGSMHVSCLEQWINQKKVDSCELCGERFPLEAQRNDVLRFIRWVFNSSMPLRRALLWDFLCSAGLIILTIFLIIFSLYWVVSEWHELKTVCSWGYNSLIVYVFICCLLYLYVIMMDRLGNWQITFQAWQSSHSVRRILVVPSQREVNVGRINDGRAAAGPVTPGLRHRR